MKSKRKIISVQIEYADQSELSRVLSKLSSKLRAPRTNNERLKIESAVVDYGIFNIDEEPDAYRVELIDGRQCIIYQSRLNEE